MLAIAVASALGMTVPSGSHMHAYAAVSAWACRFGQVMATATSAAGYVTPIGPFCPFKYALFFREAHRAHGYRASLVLSE